MTRTPAEKRAANAEYQRTWRARHPAANATMQRRKYQRARQRQLAAGWVPMTPTEAGRLGGHAAARRYDHPVFAAALRRRPWLQVVSA